MAASSAALPATAAASGGAALPPGFGAAYGLFWVPHEQAVWAPCGLQNISGDAASLRTDDGQIVVVPANDLQQLAQVQDQQLEGVDDICTLSTVNEAALLHTIRTRYAKQLIYTRVSRILISLNPFAPLPIYSLQNLIRHSSAADSLDLEPHIFGTGHDAMRGLREGSRDQAVVISGESGAGKTESAKLLLKYVAEVVRSGSSFNRGSGIEEKVMRTNPILETFGNAMTTRNNNSSRFGKWLDMRFSAALDMLGCRVTSYLLEVTRVCSQMQGERSFHIFFQLLKMKDHPMLAGLKLEDKDKYRYLCNSVHTAPGIDDVQCFDEMTEAFGTLGFSQEEQLQIFHIVVSALTLGNCDFRPKGEGVELEDKAPVERAAELLEIDSGALARCMLWRTVVTGRDATETPLREEQARAVRDGLSRMLYGHLFEWLIRRINSQLETADKGLPPLGSPAQSPPRTPPQCSPRQGSEEESPAMSADRLLGILDISGFEHFERNSLEQLLINLSNEHLQLQFNDHVFKTELEDCAKEGVSLKEAINYADNAECVALLDGRGGVLDMLDEEITMPKASDLTFATKVARELAKNSRLIMPKFSGMAIFGVHHYAGNVSYTCDGFLEKNADRLPSEDALKLLSASRLPVIATVGQLLKAQAMGNDAPSKARRGGKSATSRFRTSLRSLMAKISAADNHYVRCIKPNLEKVPSQFTAQMVREQLLFSGVLEAVRIRQQGYASRLPFFIFALRYRCVVAIRPIPSHEQREPLPPVITANGSNAEAAVRELVAQLFQKLRIQSPSGSLVFGRTKVFLKTELVVVLESARTHASMLAVLHIQRAARGAMARKRLATVKPLLLEILSWLNKHCPPSVWKKGKLHSFVFLQCLDGTFGCAERELAYIDSRCERAAELAGEFGAVQRAALAQRRLSEEVECLRAVRAALHSCSMDLEAIHAALDRATLLGIAGNIDVKNLSVRSKSIQIQLPLVKVLEEVLNSRDFVRLPSVMCEVERAGLHMNREKWLPELGGDRILSAVIAMAEEEEARRRKEEEEARRRKEEEEAARRKAEEEARRIEQEEEMVRKRQQEAEAEEARSAAMRLAQQNSSLKGAQCAALRAPPQVTLRAAPQADGESRPVEDDASGSVGVDAEALKHLVERLETSVARIKTTPLGLELSEVVQELRTEQSRVSEGSPGSEATELQIDPVALLEPRQRLMAAASRIGGVALAQELTEIAQSLGVAPAGEVTHASSTTRAFLVDMSSWSVSDLQRSVVRLMEEKEELRHALQNALLESLQREEALHTECEALRVNRPMSTEARNLEKQFETALEEEARASRAARSRLVTENSKLRAELASEQATSRVLRAELVALRALHERGGGAGVTNGIKKADMSEECAHILKIAKTVPAAPPKAASISLEDSGSVSKAPPQKPSRSVTSSEASDSPNQRDTDLKKVGARRSLSFAQRDFKPFEEANDVRRELFPGAEGACSIALHPSDVEGWYVCQDCNGQIFYQNTTTGHTQWESPQGQEAVAAESVVEQPTLVEAAAAHPSTVQQSVVDPPAVEAGQGAVDQVLHHPTELQTAAGQDAAGQPAAAAAESAIDHPVVVQPAVADAAASQAAMPDPTAMQAAAVQATADQAAVMHPTAVQPALVQNAMGQPFAAPGGYNQAVTAHMAAVQAAAMHPTVVQQAAVAQHAALQANYAMPTTGAVHPAALQPAPVEQHVDPNMYYFDTSGASGWQACTDSNGNVFYHHIASGHTQWQPPPSSVSDASLPRYAAAAPAPAGADACKTPAPATNGRAVRTAKSHNRNEMLEV